MDESQSGAGFLKGNEKAMQDLLHRKELLEEKIRPILNSMESGRADIDRVAYGAVTQPEEERTGIYRLLSEDMETFLSAHKKVAKEPKELRQLAALQEELAALSNAIAELQKDAKSKKTLLN